MTGLGYGYGYDPARIVALRGRTLDAIEALRDIRCDDPAAAEAVRVVRLLRQNLEDAWLPLVEAIHGSRAMVTWRRAVGLGTGCEIDEVVTRLVDHLGARSGWVGTSGLDELTDRQLLDRFDQVVERFQSIATAGGAIGPVWSYLDRVVTELERRLGDDGTLATRLWEHSGTAGVSALVRVLDTTGQITDLDLLAGTGFDDVATDATAATIATLLGAIAADQTDGRAALVELSATSTHLAGVMAAEPDAFDGPTLGAVTAALVGYTTGTGAWADRPRVVDRNADTDELLHALATDPVVALAFLSDPVVAAALATSPHLGDDPVENVVNAALSAPLGHGGSLVDSLRVLGTLVGEAGHRELNAGTRRGVALSAGTYLPTIAPGLDARLPVDVSVDSDVVHLGGYEDLVQLFGQVVDDTTAQLALGVVVGAFRADQVAVAARAITDRPSLLEADARAQIGAALADVSRVLELIEYSTDQRDDLLAFRHGVANSNATTILNLLGSMVSWYPPTAPLAGRISSVTTRGIVAAIGSTQPPVVPDTGLGGDLAIDFLATTLAMPLHDSTLRRRLGLDRVPDATWDELDELLEQLDDADATGDRTGTGTGDERSRVRARIRAVVDADPDLDTYLESLAASSGDAALARP